MGVEMNDWSSIDGLAAGMDHESAFLDTHVQIVYELAQVDMSEGEYV